MWRSTRMECRCIVSGSLSKLSIALLWAYTTTRKLKLSPNPLKIYFIQLVNITLIALRKWCRTGTFRNLIFLRFEPGFCHYQYFTIRQIINIEIYVIICSNNRFIRYIIYWQVNYIPFEWIYAYRIKNKSKYFWIKNFRNLCNVRLSLDGWDRGIHFFCLTGILF